MQRFFVEPYQVLEEEHRITLTGPDLNHMKNVLRMRIGEEVWISDGSEKEYHCTIEEFQEDSAVLHILYAQESQYELPSRIYLFQGLPKGDKMELIIQKAVELGAYAVVPVETRRCVVKLDAKKAQKKVTRWQQISESAAKQSKRMLIPEVKNVMSWKEALAFAKGLDVVLIPYELAQGMKETREILAAIQPGQSVGIFIGPEGGFEEEEVRDAMEAGGKPVTLGKRILRTETAGMTVPGFNVIFFARGANSSLYLPVNVFLSVFLNSPHIIKSFTACTTSSNPNIMEVCFACTFLISFSIIFSIHSYLSFSGHSHPSRLAILLSIVKCSRLP